MVGGAQKNSLEGFYQNAFLPTYLPITLPLPYKYRGMHAGAPKIYYCRSEGPF
jgi:hypothetical protein